MIAFGRVSNSVSVEHVKVEHAEKVDGNASRDVGGDHKEQIAGKLSLQVLGSEHRKVGTVYTLVGDEIHLKSSQKIVIDALRVSAKGPGGFVDVGMSGVAIQGIKVTINSGGSAGSGTTASPDPPPAWPADEGNKSAGSSSGVANGDTSSTASAASTLATSPPPMHKQEDPMSCVLASSRMIIHQFTGKDPGEEVLRKEASSAGWYDPLNGSDPWQIPSLLQAHGVANAKAEKGLTLSDIESATSAGKPVMVGLQNPGHRIVVDGVRTNKDGSKTVLTRDPAYNAPREVPSDEFLKRYNANAPVIRFDKESK